MIVRTEGILPEMEYLRPYNHDFYELSGTDGIPYAYVGLKRSGDSCTSHMRFCKFTHKTFRYFLKIDFPGIKAIAKGMGCSSLVAVYEDINDKHFYKFLAACGFGPPKILSVSTIGV